jgi:hypothetical protein
LQGYAIKSASDEYKLVVRASNPVSLANPGNGWIAKGAITEGSGFALYFFKRGAYLFEKWTLDSSCTFLSSSSISYLNV